MCILRQQWDLSAVHILIVYILSIYEEKDGKKVRNKLNNNTLVVEKQELDNKKNMRDLNE